MAAGLDFLEVLAASPEQRLQHLEAMAASGVWAALVSPEFAVASFTLPVYKCLQWRDSGPWQTTVVSCVLHGLGGSNRAQPAVQHA